ncbi:MAG TPA: YceI family protein [Anaeromyxobacteraceae bacterium]|nr:YceI family protein [Anaeromyxobacteraceae bacterium]
MPGTRRVLVAMALAASLAPGRALATGPARWSAGPPASRIVVNVYKKGLLSGMAHDHHFRAGEFRATASTDGTGPTPTAFEVVVAAGSLRDEAPDLSAADRAKVDAQAAGEDVLDALRFPEIRFAARDAQPAWPPAGPDGSAGGELRGTLTLRDRQRPVAVVVRTAPEGNGLRARGSVRFRQSDFGIEPYSGFLGMVAVEDEVQVDFDLRLTPVP